MCYTAIQLLLFDQHSLQFTSLSHRPKWKNVNEFDPSSVKNRDLEFPYFLTFAKSADARNVYMYCKCCYKLLWWEHKRIDSLFFSIFQTHRVYIYMYTISWPNLSSLSAFSITIHKSQQREERQLKKNCISSNPPSASISFAVFLKIVCLIRKKIHSYFVMFLKLCSDHYCSDTIAPIYWFKDCYFTQI